MVGLFCILPTAKRKIIPNTVLLFQALSDFIIGLFQVLASVIYSYDANSQPPVALISMSNFIFGYSQFLSITVLLIGSLERFIAIRFPFHRQRYISRSRVVAVLVIAFILCTVPMIVYVIFVELRLSEKNIINITMKEFQELNRKYKMMNRHFVITMTAIFSAEIFLVYMLLLLTYINIKRNIDSRIETREQSEGGSNNQNEGIRIERVKNVRFLKIFVFMCTSYAITFIPQISFTVYRWNRLGGGETLSEFVWTNALQLVYALSSIVNPLVTMFGKDDYRDIISRGWRRRCNFFLP